MSLASPEGWIRSSVAQRWPGTESAAIVALKGDASTRRFWRVTLQAPRFRGRTAAPIPLSAIVIDLGPDDLPLYARALRLAPEPLPEPPWLSLQRYLRTIDVAVPELYVADAAAQGDRSENAEYIYGKKKLREIDRRIHWLTKRLESVMVVAPRTDGVDAVFFGRAQ